MKCPVMQKFDEDFDLSSESCNVSDPLNFINFHIVFLILINSVNFEMLNKIDKTTRQYNDNSFYINLNSCTL